MFYLSKFIINIKWTTFVHIGAVCFPSSAAAVQAGCCQVDVWSHWALTHCVTCRVSGASPNIDDAEASSPQTAAADKTCRLPKRHRLSLLFFFFPRRKVSKLPAAKSMNEDLVQREILKKRNKLLWQNQLEIHIWNQNDAIFLSANFNKKKEIKLAVM